MKNQFIQYLTSLPESMRPFAAQIEVKFTKADGTTRKMLCHMGPDSVITDSFATVWDVEAEDYRSVRFDRLTSVKLV